MKGDDKKKTIYILANGIYSVHPNLTSTMQFILFRSTISINLILRNAHIQKIFPEYQIYVVFTNKNVGFSYHLTH